MTEIMEPCRVCRWQDRAEQAEARLAFAAVELESLHRSLTACEIANQELKQDQARLEGTETDKL